VGRPGQRHARRQPAHERSTGNYGFAALIGYKLAVVVAVSAGVLLLRSFSSHIARVTIRICAVLVALVVLTNVLQFIASR
jgi:hypothetical protein